VKKILFIFVLIVLMSTTILSADITECGEITESSVLTVDITDKSDYCFDIKTSDITFDCQGYTIDGNMVRDQNNYNDAYAYWDDYGFKLEGVTGVTIKNCIVKEFEKNIFLLNSNNNILNNLTLRTANEQSLALKISSNNNIQKINVPAGYGGISLWEGSNDNVLSDITIEDAQSLYISDSNNNQLTDITITSSDRGISIRRSDYTSVTNCNLNSNGIYGIFLGPDSDYNSVTNCNLNENAISIEGEHNILKDSTIDSNTFYGIKIEGPNNELKNNVISNNKFNIYLKFPDANNLVISKDNTVDGKEVWYLNGESGSTKQ